MLDVECWMLSCSRRARSVGSGGVLGARGDHDLGDAFVGDGDYFGAVIFAEVDGVAGFGPAGEFLDDVAADGVDGAVFERVGAEVEAFAELVEGEAA